jgi:hypothetical protein
LSSLWLGARFFRKRIKAALVVLTLLTKQVLFACFVPLLTSSLNSSKVGIPYALYHSKISWINTQAV